MKNDSPLGSLQPVSLASAPPRLELLLHSKPWRLGFPSAASPTHFGSRRDFSLLPLLPHVKSRREAGILSPPRALQQLLDLHDCTAQETGGERIGSPAPSSSGCSKPNTDRSVRARLDMYKCKKSGSGRAYVAWNGEMDKVFLDTFVEYYNRGDKCQNGWKAHVYTATIKNMKEKCNVTITKDNISSRCKTFDKHSNIINGILATSGFGWDWSKNKLYVDSDSSWEAYVEAQGCIILGLH